ncbi:hypothetical protein [Cetobacterium sp.]
MRKGLKYILLMVIFTKLIYPQEMEVGLYSFNFNKKIRTSGTRVYLTKDKKIYVELQNLLKTIGITNNKWIDEKFTIDIENIYNQEKVINLEKKYITSNDKKIFFKDEIIEKDEKIYVNVDFLPNLLGIKELEKDDDKLIVDINTSFKLPVELSNIRKYRQEEFKKNEKETKNKVYSSKKIFEAGNLRTIYNYRKNFQALNYETKTVDVEYLGPLLYGDFETYYGIYPEVKNYQTRLSYRNVYTNHAIIFGDTSVNLPRVLSGTVGGLRGISFKKDEKLVGEYSNNKVSITGSAPLGKFVELYQNGKLISYEDVKAGQYDFKEIPLTFVSDSFYVIIYNLDGSVSKEHLSRYYGEKPEKIGEFGFNIQMGKSDYYKYDQFVGEVNYGLSEKLTLKTGFYDLKYNAFYSKYNPQENKTAKLGILYVSDYSKNPYNLELNLFNSSHNNDYTYKYSQIFKEYRIDLEGGDYSNNTQKRINKKYDTGVTLSKDQFIKENINLGLKYYSTEYSYGQKVSEIGTILRVGFQNFIPEYGYYKSLIDGSTSHEFSIRSYYFRNYSVYAGITRKSLYDYDETRYKIEIMSRNYRDNGVRYRSYYEKSDRYGDVFGISFEVDYESWFSGQANYTKRNGLSHIDSGFTLDKVINLSDLNTKVTSVENTSVKGIVYVDTNNNGKYDEGVDKPLPRTDVNVYGKSSMTDENGRYSIGNLSPNSEYDLKIYPQNPLYKGKVDAYRLIPNPAAPIDLDIPVYTRKIVSGMINFPSQKLMEKYLKTLYLNIIDKQTGKKLEVSIPENDGFYVMENLIAGEYLITLESVEKPGEILLEKELTITPELREINMDLNVEGDENEKDERLAFNAVVISRN